MFNLIAAIVLTLSSGVFDAFGFVHASRAWKDDHIVLREVWLAVSLFLTGVVTYVMGLKYLARLGIEAPELQTLMWFTVTVIGVAVIQRTLVDWSTADRLVAVVAVVAVGWLVTRHG